MKFLGYELKQRRIEAIAIPTGSYGQTTTVAAACTSALDVAAAADNAERALEAARKTAARRHDENASERQRLLKVSREARDAADDAPSRRLARAQDAVAGDAERQLAALDDADRIVGVELQPLEIEAMTQRSYAHKARAGALKMLRIAIIEDIDSEIAAASGAGDSLQNEIQRRIGFKAWIEGDFG